MVAAAAMTFLPLKILKNFTFTLEVETAIKLAMAIFIKKGLNKKSTQNKINKMKLIKKKLLFFIK
ncbi:hypothetical protein I12421_05800 [Campylobacter lari]|nr:hypothetical protein I12421_05800 [Campylobacter lari]